MSEKQSPLSEAKPDSIKEFFARTREALQTDPLEHTRASRDLVVKELRRAREKFEKEDSQPKPAKKAKLEPVEGKVELGDLGL